MALLCLLRLRQWTLTFQNNVLTNYSCWDTYLRNVDYAHSKGRKHLTSCLSGIIWFNHNPYVYLSRVVPERIKYCLQRFLSTLQQTALAIISLSSIVHKSNTAVLWVEGSGILFYINTKEKKTRLREVGRETGNTWTHTACTIFKIQFAIKSSKSNFKEITEKNLSNGRANCLYMGVYADRAPYRTGLELCSESSHHH